MEITVEMASKQSREYNGRRKWGVHPKGSPKDYWLDIYVTDRPKQGQVFNIGTIKESPVGDRIFREAEIIGPAAQGAIASGQPEPLKPAPGSGNGWPARESAPTGQPAASNGKIKWSDWQQITEVAHELACKLEPDDQGEHVCERSVARAALVNTVLIAFSNGKLELPTEAGPVSREPGDDDDAYADPDAVIPWQGRG